jgi:hypothetical protein
VKAGVAALQRMELEREKMDQEPDHISTTKARAGTTPHMTRYVLGWGLGLVIVIFLILLFVWR